MIEPVPIQDTFVSGVIKIERLRGNILRFTLGAVREIENAGKIERVAVVTNRLVMDAQDTLQAARAAYYAASGLQGVVSEIVIDDTRH